jgi:hypothetical protein
MEKKLPRISSAIAAVAVSSIAISSLVVPVKAQQVLEPSQTISGRVDSTSVPVVIKNGQIRPGVEYNFTARVGDEVNVTAIKEEGSGIDVILVVIPPSQEPIQLDQDLDGGRRETFFQNPITSGGNWRVRVVSFNNQPGGYQISLLIKRNGIVVVPETPLSIADRVMKDSGLISVPCGSPDLAVIKIGAETRCTTGYPKGVYVYDFTTNTLKAEQAADPNLAMLQSWGLTTTTCSNSAVSILIDGKQYCTNPANWLSAGYYIYDRAVDRLDPIAIPAVNRPQTGGNFNPSNGSNPEL